MKEQLISQAGKLIEFTNKLDEYDQTVWLRPLANGKWTVQEVMSHLFQWDTFSYDTAIHPIRTNHPLILKNVDGEDFNRKAGVWGLSKTKEEVADAVITLRKTILDDLRLIPEENFTKPYFYPDGEAFILNEHLNDIIWHDQHHMEQIERILSK